MRSRAVAIALALLALTAGCIGAPGSNSTAPAASGTDSAGRTVDVVASGQVQVEPDRAVIRVAVTAAADSVGAVRKRLAENASRMRSALGSVGVSDDQITSAGYDIGRNYRHREAPDEPKYQGRHTFVVTLENTSRAGDIVVAAVEGGATQIEEVRFTIAPETRRELKKEALADALSNARQRANVIANSTGLAIAGVDTVRTVEVSADPVRHREFALAAAKTGDESTSFDTGKVTVTTRVQVVYNATSG